MTGLFTIAPNDQSVYYLGQIFGVISGVLPAGGSVPLLLGAMFQTLNTMFLTVGAIVVVYVTIVGVIKTASEGEFLGRQWDKTWVPLRTVFGIAALFPSGSGYSMIQVFIMWLILQGVGAADTLWNTVLNYINVAGSPTASISIPSAAISLNMQQLFQSLTCQASASARYSDSYSNPQGNQNYYYCAGKGGESFCSLSDSELLNVSTPNVYTYNFGPSGACGSLSYCNPANCPPGIQQGGTPAGTLCQAACNAQPALLQSIVTALGAVAKQYVQVDNDYMHFTYLTQNPANPLPITPWIQNVCSTNGVTSTTECCLNKFAPANPNSLVGQSVVPCTGAQVFAGDEINNGTGSGSYGNASDNAVNNLYVPYGLPKTGDFINISMNYYIGGIVSAVNTAIQNLPTSKLTGWMQDAQNTGWALAGGYYYEMAKMSGSNLQSAIPPLTVTGSDPNVPTSGSLLQTFRTNFDSVKNLMTYLQNQTQKNSNFSVSMPPQLQGVSNAVGSTSEGILNSFQNSLTQSSQPIVAVASFGYALLIAAQVLWAVIVVLSFGLGIAGGLSAFVLGTGITNPFGPALVLVWMILGPAVAALEAALFSVGAMLAIYVPFIPYMIFTIGVIGWLIAAIEAMVAGPVIALGILAPGGQHVVLGRAESAMLMMFNLILRPSLMVFGMMASMLLSVVVVNLINRSFGVVMTNIISSPGLVELILFIVVYTLLIVTALNKCFSLIYHIPDRVLTWIGGHAMSYGEEQALGQVKQGVESASSQVAKTAAQMEQGAQKAGAEAKKLGDKSQGQEGEAGAADMKGGNE